MERDTLIEVVQIIEKDEPDVEPAQGQEEGEEEQAKPDAVALRRGRREALSRSPVHAQRPPGQQLCSTLSRSSCI